MKTPVSWKGRTWLVDPAGDACPFCGALYVGDAHRLACFRQALDFLVKLRSEETGETRPTKDELLLDFVIAAIRADRWFRNLNGGKGPKDGEARAVADLLFKALERASQHGVKHPAAHGKKRKRASSRKEAR